MAMPFGLTLLLAIGDRRRRAFTKSGMIGLALAVMSLALAWLPVKGLYERVRQANNLALSGVEAPMFDTVDINGIQHRLSDHKGKVVLVNIWATWCSPCRREMPDLERLYQERKDDGFMIFGISAEDVATQQKFADEITVSYPLLTIEGEVPEIYSQSARYPANFLIDRNGRLQPAPSADRAIRKPRGRGRRAFAGPRKRLGIVSQNGHEPTSFSYLTLNTQNPTSSAMLSRERHPILRDPREKPTNSRQLVARPYSLRTSLKIVQEASSGAADRRGKPAQRTTQERRHLE